MNLALCSLASGSSGNCYLVKSNNTAILVDAGISAKQTDIRLAACGLKTCDISGILLTHEHSDHTKGLHVLLKKEGVKLYTNLKTYEAIKEYISPDRLGLFNTGDDFSIGDIDISTFRTSHDAADSVGYSFKCSGKTITIVTDTGIVTPQAYENMKCADILVLEANHDENILKVGRYPWFLKQRILSDEGHLSNDAAAKVLLKLIKEGFWCAADGTTGDVKCRQVLLAHLSAENNFPEMALATASNILEAECEWALKYLQIDTLSRTGQSSLFVV